MISSLLKNFFIIPIKIYQICLSGFFMPSCKFYPTCSFYSIEALARHGAIKGAWLSIKRLFKCNPYSQSNGFDPVP